MGLIDRLLGRNQPPEDPLNAKLEKGICPNCDKRAMAEGPWGGSAVNLRCMQCDSIYWYAPPFPAELLRKGKE